MSGPHPTTVYDAVAVKVYTNPVSKPWGVRIDGKGRPAFVGRFKTKDQAEKEAARIMEYCCTIQQQEADKLPASSPK